MSQVLSQAQFFYPTTLLPLLALTEGETENKGAIGSER